MAEWSGPGQLIGVPGYAKLSEAEFLLNQISSTQTAWFFSWGKKEVGTYRIEAEEGITANIIGGLPNVKIVIHNAGHIFPVEEIRRFIDEHIPQTFEPEGGP